MATRTAITSFKIEGATHEFTTVDGVKEDVVDIMLNLKNIRFRVFGDEEQTLRITKKGKGVVTAVVFIISVLKLLALVFTVHRVCPPEFLQ